jgi:hypothetical protein
VSGNGNGVIEVRNSEAISIATMGAGGEGDGGVWVRDKEGAKFVFIRATTIVLADKKDGAPLVGLIASKEAGAGENSLPTGARISRSVGPPGAILWPGFAEALGN